MCLRSVSFFPTPGEAKTALKRAKIPGACEDTIKDCFQFKEGGVCPFMKTFMKESCRKTCQDCSNSDSGKILITYFIYIFEPL